MTKEAHIQFTFPVGYHWFHKDQVFNYPLNRWYSFGYARFEDMQWAGQRITSFSDWTCVMLRLADAALSEGRLLNAAFYFRAAEFYTFADDPEKERRYERFMELFGEAVKDEDIERLTVPYDGAHLPVMKVPAVGARRGTIVLHGGFDSLIEEFYSWMRCFAGRGYEVVAFEGPGQGAARRKSGLAFDYHWERPTSAVLDHVDAGDVTLIGISMGGYLCFRAAALDTRITRVIASGVAYDYSQAPSPLLQPLVRFLVNHMRGFSNWAARKRMDSDPMHRWSVGNLMYMTARETPVEAIDVALQLNAGNLMSWLVEQDVLILTGNRDHFIPLKMHDMQVKALTNARSVTARVFTAEEHAENHCQVGNIGLALKVMTDWLDDLASAACQDSR